VWRDFYAHLLWHEPRLGRTSFRPSLDQVAWEHDPRVIDAWRTGRTGYPVVDAAMHQLTTSGWMHNRARMIVGSFLTKDLQQDWREGERHFMAHLLDGDVASNNGGWQWIASTGVDPKPYFQRLFNPMTQQRRFDADGRYVRHWCPELRRVPDARLPEPWTMTDDEHSASGDADDLRPAGPGGRQILLADLPPGKHLFSAKGRNGQGVWSAARRIEIVVPPPYWMTWWFRASVGAVALGVALGAHRVRTSSLARRNRQLEELQAQRERAFDRLRHLTRRFEAAKEEERKRIARELHDDLGPSLTAVIINLQLLADPAHAGGSTKRLADSTELVDRIIQQIRDLSLALRPGRHVYVAFDGSDANPGTFAQPWRDLDRPGGAAAAGGRARLRFVRRRGRLSRSRGGSHLVRLAATPRARRGARPHARQRLPRRHCDVSDRRRGTSCRLETGCSDCAAMLR
jgi:hypothetical protein